MTMIEVGQKRRAPSGLVFEVIVTDLDEKFAVVKELRLDGTWSLWPSEVVKFEEFEQYPLVE
jgi:hypothetical protein